MNLLGRIEFPNLFSGEIAVDRVAFELFGIKVYWYGVIITIAVILGILYALKRSKVVGVIPDNVFDIAFWGVVCGIIGARTYYVIFTNLNPESYTKYNLYTAITGIRDGGLAIYGGLIGAVLGALIASRALKIKLLPVLDLAGLGFLIGHCVGRWGNFVNQEAFGAPTASDLPWGMTGDGIIRGLREIGADVNALVHPCFLYESLWCLLGFIILHFYIKKLRTFDGEIFLLYIVWYGSGRAFIEQLRTDSLMAGDLKVSQVLAASSAIFAFILFAYFKITLSKNKDYCIYVKTSESAKLIENYKYRLKLIKEQEKAKQALKRTQDDLNAPVAQSIIESVFENEEETKTREEDDKNGEKNREKNGEKNSQKD